jgi:hypothetical protein
MARLLRQFGYATLLFPSAKAFANHGDFANAVWSTWAMGQASN